MSSKSLHVVHQQRYHERKQAGLKPVKAAWHWLTQAQLHQLSLEAYKAASWACRDQGVHPAGFVDELGRQLHMRLAAAALDAGIEGCPTEYLHLRAQLEATLPDLPRDWRPQYPIFAAPQLGGASINPGPARREPSIEGGLST